MTVINEKSHSKQEEDTDNKEGLFKLYKEVLKRFTQIMNNNTYQQTSTKARTVIEGQLKKHHFKSLTDCNNSLYPTSFFHNSTLNTLINDR